MINRRHLRVKVLQTLYAFYQSHNPDLDSGIRELKKNIEKVHDLFVYQLMLLAELRHQEERILEERQQKHLPTEEDLHPNRRFAENRVLVMVSEDENLQKLASEKKISWAEERDLVRKLLRQIQNSNYYKTYIETESIDESADLRFVIKMLEKDIVDFEPLHSFYEEKSIYWIDDWELVHKKLIKTIKLSVENGCRLLLPDLFRDISDREFAFELFKRAILNHQEFFQMISAKTQNWDADRIALMDMIIMELAITEVLKFPDIPVKVSLNEYIELSKMYSTPKSKVFVNGVLDKLLEEFVKERKIAPY